MYVSPLPGSAWSKACDETRQDLAQKFGAQATVVQPIPENTDVVGTFQDLIRKGNKLIFATAFGYQPFVAGVAKQNPDVDFVVTGPWAQKEPRPKNVSSVCAKLWEARYLAGIVAASMSKSKTLGFGFAFSIPSVVAGINGFQEGRSRWTLAKSGPDVIAKHEDSIGPQLGGKAAGVWGIGSEVDTSAQTPDTYRAGSVDNWKPYSEEKYKQAEAGTFTTLCTPLARCTCSRRRSPIASGRRHSTRLRAAPVSREGSQ